MLNVYLINFLSKLLRSIFYPQIPSLSTISSQLPSIKNIPLCILSYLFALLTNHQISFSLDNSSTFFSNLPIFYSCEFTSLVRSWVRVLRLESYSSCYLSIFDSLLFLFSLLPLASESDRRLNLCGLYFLYLLAEEETLFLPWSLDLDLSADLLCFL